MIADSQDQTPTTIREMASSLRISGGHLQDLRRPGPCVRYRLAAVVRAGGRLTIKHQKSAHQISLIPALQRARRD